MENTEFPLDLIALFVIIAGIVGICWYGLVREKRARMRSWKPDLHDVARNRPRRSWADDVVVHSSPCVRAEARGVRVSASDDGDEGEWDVIPPVDEGSA